MPFAGTGVQDPAGAGAAGVRRPGVPAGAALSAIGALLAVALPGVPAGATDGVIVDLTAGERPGVGAGVVPVTTALRVERLGVTATGAGACTEVAAPPAALRVEQPGVPAGVAACLMLPSSALLWPGPISAAMLSLAPFTAKSSLSAPPPATVAAAAAAGAGEGAALGGADMSPRVSRGGG